LHGHAGECSRIEGVRHVTSLALVTKFVMLWLPSWLKQVFVCGVISTETDPVHRVVIHVAPADTRHVPFIVIIWVLPSGRAGQSVISRWNDSCKQATICW